MAPPRTALRPWVVDLAVVVGASGLLVAGALVVADDPGEPSLTVAGGAILVASAVVLGWRRSHPLLVAAASGACSAAYGVAELPDPAFPVAGIIALYAVARWRSRAWTGVAAAVVALAATASMALTHDSGADDYYRNLLPAAVALVLGDQVRERARAEALRRAADLDAAVGSERRRIARELHDVVAHHVTMVVVQAEAGGAAADGVGDLAAAGRFDEISASARAALGELRHLLAVLRDADEGAGTAPQPGLADLPALFDRVRATGLPVEVASSGPARALPAGVDLSAYRIVQEALTNVVRHAGSATTRVALDWSAEQLVVTVVDDGANRPPRPGSGSGRGLVGMVERAELLGGRLEAGPRSDGGFAVRATLPIGPAAR